MSDIVERLQHAHLLSTQRVVGSTIFTEAADEITRLRASLADERKRALEEAAKALDAWGDIYGDNAAKTVRALKETTK